MKVAILGFGKQGRSAYEYWNHSGNEITIRDQSESLDLPQDVRSKLGESHLKNLSDFDLIVRSPTIHPDAIIKASGADILSKVTTNTNEFFKVCPTKNIVGVTGTKGKGTTSTLIAKILEASGKTVHLGGNIGIAPLDLLKDHIEPDHWVVLELANFQLIDLKYSPHIGVCLMVVDEHLDWHDSSQDYIDSKKSLFAYQKSDDYAVYYSDNEHSKEIASGGSGQKIPYMEQPGAIVEDGNFVIDGTVICKTSEIKLLGKHNWQNICAAITAVWQVSKDTNAMRSVLSTFSGLEHRLEFVRELENVKYYDDSFGTTPETAIVALEALDEPKIIILGGSDKGSDFHELANAVQNNGVKEVLVIGKTKDKIRSALNDVGFDNISEGGNSMDEIVNNARSKAKAGDVVLLSTGCASFGMFENYIDRGDQFKEVVQALV